MTPAQFIAEIIEPPVVHDLLHVGLFFADLLTSLALGGIVFLLALCAPGLRL